MPSITSVSFNGNLRGFKAAVQFVPKHDGLPGDYYRLRLDDLTVFATPDQLCQIMAAIAKGIQPTAAPEIPVLEPVAAKCQPLTAPEFAHLEQGR